MRRRIAINGFGRIGRLAFRSIFERHLNELEIVAINDPAGAHTGALLLKYENDVAPDLYKFYSEDLHMDQLTDASDVTWTNFFLLLDQVISPKFYRPRRKPVPSQAGGTAGQPAPTAPSPQGSPQTPASGGSQAGAPAGSSSILRSTSVVPSITSDASHPSRWGAPENLSKEGGRRQVALGQTAGRSTGRAE